MVSAMAADFLAEHQHGPVCLIGYSFGGLLAVELGRQLADSGKLVSLVGVVDTMPPPGSFTRLFRIKHFAESVGPWALTVATRVLANPKYRSSYRSAAVQTLAGQQRFEAEGWYQKLPMDVRDFFNRNIAMGRKYLFEGTFRGTIVLFRQRPRPAQDAHPLQPRQLPDYGWKRVTGAEVDVVHIPGDHGSCLQEPNVLGLADELLHVLDKHYYQPAFEALQLPAKTRQDFGGRERSATEFPD
jgi:thioesterase domain-containing protein